MILIPFIAIALGVTIWLVITIFLGKSIGKFCKKIKDKLIEK